MREMDFQSLNETIEKNRKKVNGHIARTLSPTVRRRTRPRSWGEREALNQISISRWNKAVESGKVRKISERVWYYDYRD